LAVQRIELNQATESLSDCIPRPRVLRSLIEFHRKQVELGQRLLRIAEKAAREREPSRSNNP
jgi:hypothetical protein